jgi:kynurenine formamidase
LAISLVGAFSGVTFAAQEWCPDDRPANWPSNWGKWGPDDEIGTLNYITPEVIKAAADLVKQGRVISLAMDNTPRVSPKWPGRYGLIRHMKIDGADFLVERPAGNIAWTESVIQLEDHGSTHLDPLVHLWWGNCTYNDYPAPEIVSRFKGITKGSTNAYLPRSFTRGVLIDVAKYLGVDFVDKIDGGTVLTPELIDKIAAAQGVEITPGTALLIRTGWVKHWTGAGKDFSVADGEVGISCGIEEWLQKKKVALIGCDNVAVEAIPATDECNEYYKSPLVPMHVGVLSMLGVPMLELMDLDELAADCAKDGVYEFAFSFAPFRYVNASGGLTSPTALK